jgi:hypothetical protein
MFVFVESPLMGVPISFVGVATASFLKKMSSGTGEVFGDLFMQSVLREYFSFQPTQMIRNGVNIDSQLSSNQKVFLNWWITTVVYSMAHAGSTIANASTLGEFDYGVSLVAYSMIWPLLTQQLQTRVVVPKLFYKYPTIPKLKKIYDPTYSAADLIEEETRAIRQTLEGSKNRAGVNSGELKEFSYEGEKYFLTESEFLKIKIAMSDSEWIKWFRSDKHFDGKVKKIAKLKFWMQKTGVAGSYAVSLISLYWTMRWWAVGTDSKDNEDWGPLTQLIQSLHAVLVENGLTTLPITEYSEIVPLMKDALIEEK